MSERTVLELDLGLFPLSSGTQPEGIPPEDILLDLRPQPLNRSNCVSLFSSDIENSPGNTVSDSLTCKGSKASSFPRSTKTKEVDKARTWILQGLPEIFSEGRTLLPEGLWKEGMTIEFAIDGSELHQLV